MLSSWMMYFIFENIIRCIKHSKCMKLFSNGNKINNHCNNNSWHLLKYENGPILSTLDVLMSVHLNLPSP